MTMNRASSEFENGRRAFHDGVAFSDNPYSVRTQNYSHKQWHAGWEHAQRRLDVVRQHTDAE